MSKYFFSLLFLCFPVLLFAQQSDSSTIVSKKDEGLHQLRFGVDVSKILINQLIENRTAYEGSVDYYFKNEMYGVLDFGAGNSNINYSDLKYTTNNIFFRAGLDKGLFERKRPQDWGMGFIGFRYGVGIVKRNEAKYTTNDGLGGVTSGIIPANNFTAHWFELTGGMRLELVKGIFAGWNVRFKFLLNQKSLGALKPAYIAGYGPGEKGTAFDYNFYLAYAIKWSSKK